VCGEMFWVASDTARSSVLTLVSSLGHFYPHLVHAIRRIRKEFFVGVLKLWFQQLPDVGFCFWFLAGHGQLHPWCPPVFLELLSHLGDTTQRSFRRPYRNSLVVLCTVIMFEIVWSDCCGLFSSRNTSLQTDFCVLSQV